MAAPTFTVPSTIAAIPAAAPKTVTGARAIVTVNGQTVGIYESCTFNTSFGTEPVHTLGKYNPQEIVVTSAEAVTLNCSGFRVVGAGLTTAPGVPLLSDLLGLESMTIVVADRQTGSKLLTVLNCVVTSYSGNFNAKATSKISVTYSGTAAFDESTSSDDDKSSNAGVSL